MATLTVVLPRSGLREASPSHSHIADPKRSLLARWRQPALSIHKVDVSGPSQKTLIPSWACASVSIRIVPDQSLLVIVEQLKAHLHKAFGALRTHNSLEVEINHLADWWLGEVESPYFKALSECVEQAWGVKPLYIREGGSIPSIPFLEREFAVDAVHLPMGTSTDAAHLPDERIRVVNLEVGPCPVRKWLSPNADHRFLVLPRAEGQDDRVQLAPRARQDVKPCRPTYPDRLLTFPAWLPITTACHQQHIAY